MQEEWRDASFHTAQEDAARLNQLAVKVNYQGGRTEYRFRYRITVRLRNKQTKSRQVDTVKRDLSINWFLE